MTVADIAFYAQQADAMSRHGLRVQTYAHGAAYHQILNPSGFRAYVTLGKYRQPPEVHFVNNPAGQRHWFVGKQYRVLKVVLAELAAKRVLHSVTIARLAGCSQGYATKMMQRIALWGFMFVDSIKRGRFGGIKAHLIRRVRQSFLPLEDVSMYGGMINARMSNFLAHKIVQADHDAYVATLADGDLYVPASRR